MRPVEDRFETSQNFGDGATEGVGPGDAMWPYVKMYGNYQPYGHAGMDIACPIGTPIVAPADGTVLYAGWTEDLPGVGDIRQWLMYYNFGGILTAIQHDGWISFIAHQSDNDMIHVGQRVREGQLIGLSGNTKTRDTYVDAHAHVEALVYMDYRTRPAEGIIYGRVDPRLKFGSGGIAAQGTITTEETVAFSPDQEKFILDALTSLVDNVATKKDVPTAAENKFVQAALTSLVNNVATKADLAGVSAAVANAVGAKASVEEIKAAVQAGMAAGLKVDVTVNGKAGA